MKLFIKPLCIICSKKLYFNSITVKNYRNYVFFKGKYYCNSCFGKKLKNFIIT